VVLPGKAMRAGFQIIPKTSIGAEVVAPPIAMLWASWAQRGWEKRTINQRVKISSFFIPVILTIGIPLNQNNFNQRVERREAGQV
jgi:hypothetical protein